MPRKQSGTIDPAVGVHLEVHIGMEDLGLVAHSGREEGVLLWNGQHQLECATLEGGVCRAL